jgi:hypothetical protein
MQPRFIQKWLERWRAWRAARFERDVINDLQVSQEWQQRFLRRGGPR